MKGNGLTVYAMPLFRSPIPHCGRCSLSVFYCNIWCFWINIAAALMFMLYFTAVGLYHWAHLYCWLVWSTAMHQILMWSYICCIAEYKCRKKVYFFLRKKGCFLLCDDAFSRWSKGVFEEQNFLFLLFVRVHAGRRGFRKLRPLQSSSLRRRRRRGRRRI